MRGRLLLTLAVASRCEEESTSRDPLAHVRSFNVSSPFEIAQCATLRVRGLHANGSLGVTPAICQVEKKRKCGREQPASRHLVPLRRAEEAATDYDSGGCVLIPCYHAHFIYLDRLLRGVLSKAVDRARLIVVFSQDALGSLADFCARFPAACERDAAAALSWEVTDLVRLVQLSLHSQDEANPYLSSHGRHFVEFARKARGRSEQLLADLHEQAPWTRPIRPHGAAGGARIGSKFVHVQNLYLQALKKMLGVGHTGCKRAWVIDSESVPFRRFSFGEIIDGYWAWPTVLHNGPLTKGGAHDAIRPEAMGLRHAQPGFSWCNNASTSGPLYPNLCRGYSAGLLGMPPANHPYLHNDYWHWSHKVVRDAMSQAAHAQFKAGHSAPTFMEAYVRSPAHELLYYSFAELRHRAEHRYEASVDVIDRFYRELGGFSRGLSSVLLDPAYTPPLVDPTRCRRWGGHPPYPQPHYSTNQLIESGLPHMCALLGALGYRGFKWFVDPSQSTACHTTERGLRLSAARLAACPNVSWWLSSEFSLTSVDELEAFSNLSLAAMRKLVWTRMQNTSLKELIVRRAVGSIEFEGDELVQQNESYRLGSGATPTDASRKLLSPLPVRCTSEGRAVAADTADCVVAPTAEALWWWPLLLPLNRKRECPEGSHGGFNG
jgi:hypothetical protein